MDEHFQVREMEFFQISAFLVVFPFFPSDNSVMIKVRLGAYVRRRLTLLFFGDNKLKSNRNKYRCRFFILHLFAIIINDRQWQKLLAVDDRNLSFFLPSSSSSYFLFHQHHNSLTVVVCCFIFLTLLTSNWVMWLSFLACEKLKIKISIKSIKFKLLFHKA
jgi:hypothetical protein